MGIPANIIYFTGYDWLRFDDNSPVRKIIPEAWAPLVSGSSARILAGTAVSPIEMLRTRMQAASVGENHFSRTVEGIQKIIADNGYSYLWRGLTLTLWRDVPFSGIYWTGYEFLTKKFTKLRSERLVAHKQACRTNALVNEKISRENEAVKFTDSFLSGALSGAFASFLTMPFDVGKTRRQVFVGKEDLMNRRYNLAAPEERPMIRFLWHIFQEEGLSGLWRGWIPRALKVAPACAIMISSYEIGKQSFYRMNENSLQKRAL
ncbi:putative solute carrier family 25 member 40 [Erysiphe necator]|uniref:Putative solute carrier family 25 member 40 n=1 Tax=Uncinula necator TaxID=52586 RepID=A0A0B1P3L7_UNCNE|nr:putative solute carrier family 25 member 40 [Erysiphe necator]